MSEDKDKGRKKGFPGSFMLFLFAALIIAMTVQGFVGGSSANISFSYQLEPLVNLQLIEDQESTKVSIKDNLFTFSGKFKEELGESSLSRFKYLQSLNGYKKFEAQKNRLEGERIILRQQAEAAAAKYLAIADKQIDKDGYVVVGDVYNVPGRSNALIIQNVENVFGVVDAEEYLEHFDPSSQETLSYFEGELLRLINDFQSSVLGIRDEKIKENLRELEGEVFNYRTDSQRSVEDKIILYSRVVGELKSVSNSLNREEDYARLRGLYSSNSYMELIPELQVVDNDLEEAYDLLSLSRPSLLQGIIWYYNDKELSTRELEMQDNESFMRWFDQAQVEWDNFEVNRGAVFKAPDQPRNIVLDKLFRSKTPAPNYMSYVFSILPIVLVLSLLYFIFSRQMKGMGGASGAMSFGKSPAKMLMKDDNKITFKDVAGIEEAKEELEEIIEFLKNPDKFTALGGRIPKGVLCIGAPGTGKTLIAKAVAGEADRPFFSISGSDFVEMFVGVGASRIRDMFAQAKKNSPCIIFIDEIDAVGRHRGSGIGGGHDEREQTLNQLLVEMDGFNTNEGVILMAATNRPDVLDKALLRPGRFDRRIYIDLPDVKGRNEILKVHARKIKLAKDVELMDIARATAGSSGADLENLLNEAALIAARKERKAVTVQDVREASDKVRFGKERRSLELDDNEKLTTAYHESGHAIAGLTVEFSDPVDKVTIIPRGPSLGATHFLPRKNRLSYWKKELLDQLKVMMGGRVAEEIFVGDISSGAQQDIAQATHIARSMVCQWGMSANIGPVAYDDTSSSSGMDGVPGFYQKKYSEASSQAIDKEVKDILEVAYQEAKELLNSKKEFLETMKDALLEFETLDSEDCAIIMKGEWDPEAKRQKEENHKELHKVETPPKPALDENTDADKDEKATGEEIKEDL